MRVKTIFCMGMIVVLLGSFLPPRSSFHHIETIIFVETQIPSQCERNVIDLPTIPSIYDSNLTQKYFNTESKLGDLTTKIQSDLFTNNLLDNRDPAIFSTWLAVESLRTLNYSHLMTTNLRNNTIEYLISCMNASNIFAESINYSIYEGKNEDLFLYAPYTPTVIHQVAVIALGKLNALPMEFSPDQLFAWKASILDSQNIDGGFGTRIRNNTRQSTIVETYFAIAALTQLNLALSQSLSPTMNSNIQTFLMNHQSKFTVYPNPAFGCFYESSNYTYRGWGWLVVDWFACQIIELINADRSLFASNFTTFLQTWEIYNPDTLCFLHDFNDRDNDNLKSYIGTAVMGECIRILGLEGSFPVSIAQAELFSGMGDRQYFRPFDVSEEHDLSDQFFFTQYLNHSAILPVIPESQLGNIVDHTTKYFALEGGASFQNNWDRSTASEATVYKFLSEFVPDLHLRANDLFWKLFQRKSISGFFFEDRIRKNETLEGTKMFDAYNAPWKNPIATNYYVFAAFEKLGLMTTFYTVVGWQNYLKYEAWPRSHLLADGSFTNHSQSLSGNLESTYQALETQRILIEFDTGQTIDAFYSAADKILIRNYVCRFIHSNTTQWWADQPGLSRNDATFYAMRILELLGMNATIDASKLSSFIGNQIKCPIGFDFNLAALVSQFHESLLSQNIPIRPDHMAIITTITRLQEQSQAILTTSIRNLLHFVPIAKNIPLRVCVIDRPQIHPHGILQNYTIALCDWLGTESLSNLTLTGENFVNYTNWSEINQIYTCSICPEYSLLQPEVWVWGITFQSGEKFWQMNSDSFTSWELDTSWTINSSAPFPFVLEILGSSTLLDVLSASVQIRGEFASVTFSLPIERTQNSLKIQKPFTALNLPSGMYNLTLNLWNTPESCWNSSDAKHSIEFNGIIVWNASDDFSPNENDSNLGDGENFFPLISTTNETSAILDPPSLSIIIGSLSGAVGVTQFARNSQFLKKYKRK